MGTGSDDLSRPKGLVLSRETLMPLGVVVSLLAGAIYIGGTMAGVQHEIAMLRKDLVSLQTELRLTIHEREFRAWVELLRALNPSLAVPDVTR